MQQEIQRLQEQSDACNRENREIKRENQVCTEKNELYIEEIKLLKDFVYGLDSRSKEVHKFKFLNQHDGEHQQLHQDLSPRIDNMKSNSSLPRNSSQSSISQI